MDNSLKYNVKMINLALENTRFLPTEGRGSTISVLSVCGYSSNKVLLFTELFFFTCSPSWYYIDLTTKKSQVHHDISRLNITICSTRQGSLNNCQKNLKFPFFSIMFNQIIFHWEILLLYCRNISWDIKTKSHDI